MIVNQSNLATLYTAFNTAFKGGLGMAGPLHDRVATTVPSATRETEYGWLGQIPGFREWLGDRVINNIRMHDYTIRNKAYENTIEVDRDDIEDDQYGVYSMLFQHMGMGTAAHPSELVFAALKAGFTTACYDGQYMFDTDHPVLDGSGATTTVANTDGGDGDAWFLIDATRPLKPIIFQKRRDYDFVAMDDARDESVFARKKFRYGVDARLNVGYGLWQTAWGSKQPLVHETFIQARTALTGMKGDYGRPLGLMPNLLVVPPSLESAAEEIVKRERDVNGATNINRGKAEVLVSPWLA